MTERERLQDYVGNGDKAKPTFSAAEMQRRLDAIIPNRIGHHIELLEGGYHGKSGQDLLKDGSDLQNVEARIGMLVGHTSDAESRAFSAIDRLHTRAESFRFAGKWC